MAAVVRARDPASLPDPVIAVEKARQLKAAIRASSSIIALASNPLLVTILGMMVFDESLGSGIPTHRAMLYSASLDYLLDLWTKTRSADQKDRPSLKKPELVFLMQKVAIFMHENASSKSIGEAELKEQLEVHLRSFRRDISEFDFSTVVDDLVVTMQRHVGLLAEAGRGFYRFLHLTFQEFLVARELLQPKPGQPNPGEAVERMLAHLHDTSYWEPILLALGYASSRTAPGWTEQAHQKLLGALMIADEKDGSVALPRAALLLATVLPELERPIPDDCVDGAVSAIGKLIEHAWSELLAMERPRAVVDRFLRAKLANSGAGDPAMVRTCATLLHRLGRSATFLNELQVALPADAPTRDWPIHTALHGQAGSSNAPFAVALMDDAKLLQAVKSDPVLEAVCIAICGGIPWLPPAFRAQQELRKLHLYEQFGGIAQNAAWTSPPALEAFRKQLVAAAAWSPCTFSPAHIVRDSPAALLLLDFLREGELKSTPLHTALPKLFSPDKQADFARLWIAHAISNARPEPPFWSSQDLRRQLLELRAEVQAGIVWAGHEVLHALADYVTAGGDCSTAATTSRLILTLLGSSGCQFGNPGPLLDAVLERESTSASTSLVCDFLAWIHSGGSGVEKLSNVVDDAVAKLETLPGSTLLDAFNQRHDVACWMDDRHQLAWASSPGSPCSHDDVFSSLTDFLDGLFSCHPVVIKLHHFILQQCMPLFLSSQSCSELLTEVKIRARLTGVQVFLEPRESPVGAATVVIDAKRPVIPDDCPFAKLLTNCWALSPYVQARCLALLLPLSAPMSAWRGYAEAVVARIANPTLAADASKRLFGEATAPLASPAAVWMMPPLVRVRESLQALRLSTSTWALLLVGAALHDLQSNARVPRTPSEHWLSVLCADDARECALPSSVTMTPLACAAIFRLWSLGHDTAALRGMRAVSRPQPGAVGHLALLYRAQTRLQPAFFSALLLAEADIWLPETAATLLKGIAEEDDRTRARLVYFGCEPVRGELPVQLLASRMGKRTIEAFAEAGLRGPDRNRRLADVILWWTVIADDADIVTQWMAEVAAQPDQTTPSIQCLSYKCLASVFNPKPEVC